MVPACWAVIPAAGVGARVTASPVPKQYLRIEGKTILEHSLTPFLNSEHIAGVVVALHAEDQWFADLTIDCKNKELWIVQGGATRAQSVSNALMHLQGYAGKSDFVLVHDAARPCLTSADLRKLINVCIADAVGGILAVPLRDTIKKVQEGSVVETISREDLWRALTPQMFRFGLLTDALRQAMENEVEVTDEASAVERYGFRPRAVEGDARNIKVTTTEDIPIAQLFIQSLQQV